MVPLAHTSKRSISSQTLKYCCSHNAQNRFAMIWSFAVCTAGRPAATLQQISVRHWLTAPSTSQHLSGNGSSIAVTDVD